MRYLLQQSIDVFNVYGKEPEQMTNILHGFEMILEPFDHDTITAGFREWMQDSATMPTPADILKITKRITESRRSPYGAVKTKHGYPPRPYNPDAVPWSCMTYKTIIHGGLMDQLTAHMETFPNHEAKEKYRKYLVDRCEFPKDWGR